ncbi:MAG: hypothetical protein Q8Q35_03555 [Nanoarchaeota archaeon]|nr:hypothetical protein [Nanoarchaeota archaeon]
MKSIIDRIFERPVKLVPKDWFGDQKEITVDVDYLRRGVGNELILEIYPKGNLCPMSIDDLDSLVGVVNLLRNKKEGNVYENNGKVWKNSSYVNFSSLGYLTRVSLGNDLEINRFNVMEYLEQKIDNNRYGIILDEVVETDSGLLIVGRGGPYNLDRAFFPEDMQIEMDVVLPIHSRLSASGGSIDGDFGKIQYEDGSFDSILSEQGNRKLRKVG